MDDTVKAILDLPEVRSVERMALNPGDTIVLTFKGRVRQQTLEIVKATMEGKFPGHKCLVLEEGADIKVIRES